LKFRDFHPRLGFTQQDRARCASFPLSPLPSLFFGAGFVFASGSIVSEVPYDPALAYAFLGEETTMCARLFTNGYDLFSPATNIVYHCTPRDYRHVFWEQLYKKDGICKVPHETRVQRKTKEAQSNSRMTDLLMGLPIDPPFGLGSARTLEEFQDFTGLDIQGRRHKRHTKLGLTRDASPEEKRAKYGT
jgi:hypothetical protein